MGTMSRRDQSALIFLNTPNGGRSPIRAGRRALLDRVDAPLAALLGEREAGDVLVLLAHGGEGVRAVELHACDGDVLFRVHELALDRLLARLLVAAGDRLS